jgi:hypothetical protein
MWSERPAPASDELIAEGVIGCIRSHVQRAKKPSNPRSS